MLTAESPNMFCGYWSTEKLWLKPRTLLLFCVSYTCHPGSHTAQQILLVLPSVTAALERWLQTQDDNQNTQTCRYKHRYTHWTKEVTTKRWASRWSCWLSSNSKELTMLGTQAQDSNDVSLVLPRVIQQKLPLPLWVPQTNMKSVEFYVSLIHETTPEWLRTLFYTYLFYT